MKRIFGIFNISRTLKLKKCKKMSFKDARKKLIAIADGDYNSLSYEVSTYSIATVSIKCRIYVSNYSFHTGETLEEAFKSLDKEMNPPAGLKEKDIENVEHIDDKK